MALKIAPATCPLCNAALDGLLEPHASGGHLNRCSECRKFFVVTRLPEMFYAQVDNVKGVWFENVSPVSDQAIGMTQDDWEHFETSIGQSDFGAARKIIERRENDLAKMILEIAFFLALLEADEVTEELRKQSLASAVRFLVQTDPSSYLLPINEELPKGTYGTENPIDYAPAGSTLVVLRPSLGMILRDHFVDEAVSELKMLHRNDDPTLLARMKEPLVANHTFHRWKSLSWLTWYVENDRTAESDS